MKLGIVGLPNVGKSTLFNSLTKAGAESANYPFCTIDPNVGIVAVPDERLRLLGEMYHSRKVTPAAIEFVDIAGLVKGASKGEGLGNQFLSNIREVDAIVHVVRCFADDNVVHVDGSVNPLRDIETINLELIFSDLEILERRIAKVSKGAKMDKGMAKELALLKRLRDHLEGGSLALGFDVGEDEDESAMFDSYNLLTAKPVIFAANVGESDLADDGASNEGVSAVRAFAQKTGSEVFVISAQIEQEIAELDEEEKAMFLEELGLEVESQCKAGVVVAPLQIKHLQRVVRVAGEGVAIFLPGDRSKFSCFIIQLFESFGKDSVFFHCVHIHFPVCFWEAICFPALSNGNFTSRKVNHSVDFAVDAA